MKGNKGFSGSIWKELDMIDLEYNDLDSRQSSPPNFAIP